MNEINASIALRRALGAYATGVTIVAVPAAGGGGFGITVNSFHSVSLSPPLIGWCIGKDSLRFRTFADAPAFGISVLAGGQSDLAQRFATDSEITPGDARFEHGAEGALLVQGAVSRFACSVWARNDAGDHVALIGEVKTFDGPSEAEALTFLRGAYGTTGRLTGKA